MTNPAIEAIEKLMHSLQCTPDWPGAADFIAAVLDNLPRAEMDDAAARALPTNIPRFGYAREALDAAIAAARATLLPGDA